VTDPGTRSNRIQGNLIGLDATGSVPVPNGLGGVGVFQQADATTIGGPTADDGNLISANGVVGAPSAGGGLSYSGTGQITVQNNKFGLDAAGAGAPNVLYNLRVTGSAATGPVIRNNQLLLAYSVQKDGAGKGSRQGGMGPPPGCQVARQGDDHARIAAGRPRAAGSASLGSAGGRVVTRERRATSTE